MEAYSSHSHHSRSHSKPHSFFNKKPPLSGAGAATNGGGGALFAAAYDDVFGGPPRYAALAPRPEDYSEIFASFRSSSSSSSRASSSIPVLDLPAVTADVDGVNFDYSDVFGSFNAVEFAVPFDELFRPFDCNAGAVVDADASSDDAWTPVGTESLSDDSDPFAFSEKSQSFSNGNFHQPLDTKQFNVSYHKVNIGTDTSVPNMTHVAQLNVVPGYTCVVDETTSLREMGTEGLCSTTVDDIIFNADSSSIMSQKQTKKAMSEMSHDNAGVNSFKGERRRGRARSASVSHVNLTFGSVSETNLKTEASRMQPPSRTPPVPAEGKGDFSSFTSRVKAYDNDGLDATRLPPCFDMEVDASSSAAVSAAAMKDAMVRAQAKLKAAKVMMDKRKDGVQSTVKPGLKANVNNDKVELDECVFGDNRVQTASDGVPAKMRNSVQDKQATTASQICPDVSEVEQPTVVSGKSAERKRAKKCGLSSDTALPGVAGEWKEATQYYEFVNNDNCNLSSQPPGTGDRKTAALKQQGDDDEHNSDSGGDGFVPEVNRPRLKATKAVSRQAYYEKMVKVVQEAHDTVTAGRAETYESLTGMPQEKCKEQKAKSVSEPEKKAGIIIQGQRGKEAKAGEGIKKQEEEMTSKNALEKEGIAKKETRKKEAETCHIQQNVTNANGLHESMVKEVHERNIDERRTGVTPEWVESERRLQNTVVREEDEKGGKEACERQRKESKLVNAVKQTKDEEGRAMDTRSNEPFENGFGGERRHTACESQDNGKTNYLKRKEDNGSNEAFQDVIVVEALQIPRASENNDNPEDLLRRDEYEYYDKETVEGRRRKQSIEECIPLDECWEYKEAHEQVTRTPKLDEACKVAADEKKSEEGEKLKGTEDKLQKITEQETVAIEAMHAGELEDAKILDNTGDAGIKIEWEDEDQGSARSPGLEPPKDNEHLKSSDGASFHKKDVEMDTVTSTIKKQQREAVGSAWKENDEISSVSSDEEIKSKPAKTTEVLIDEKPRRDTAAQMGVDVNDHERKLVCASDSLEGNSDNNNLDEACTISGHSLKEENKKVAQPVSEPKSADNFNLEQGGKRENVGEQGQVPCDREEKIKSTTDERCNGWNEHARKKAGQAVMPERKESIQKRSEVPNVGQTSERKGKVINQHSSSEEKTKEKERDFEKEQLRKLEEEREREREREKDRMAVEIAIREARERAYSDARDRAERAALERATDEARQRAMAEARERLEKACAEARERSLADKNSEARLRAERAAVERATAEARQRAIEKVMVDRANLEARERMQRSVSEKFASEREVVRRQSSFPSTSEKFEASDCEPAQRCKARLERHRRTVERVAKALAEKNMRDLLAQREQAERNRLAETLDADIKRWSSGKEGNLRALLSTLQYILGHDSGWQPIPLTEVITAAAVKKAYRKATLCVHPDKLQQRGASIQQKYICEKVFDLLKEAWNRFNSEEK